MLKNLKATLRPYTLLLTSPCFKSYAQAGEDGIILSLMKTLSISPCSTTYLDVGANHPKYHSTTYALYKAGARGVAIEPNPALHLSWRLCRCADTLLRAGITPAPKAQVADYWAFNRHTLNTFSATQAKQVQQWHPDEAAVKPLKLPLVPWAEALALLPSAPTLVNLDVEGLDVELLKAFPFKKSRPLLWCVESVTYNLKGHTKVPEVGQILEKQGYTCIAENHVNSLFIDTPRWLARK